MRTHNYLYLIWKNPESRRNYIVGKLEKKNSGYVFEYCNEFQDALDSGWMMIQAFPENKRYESKDLFSFFSSRLPDRKRKGIEDILKKYGLESYDGFELLRKSGGRLPIDTFELIDPIFDDDQTIERELYIVGVRHLSGCEGKNCAERPVVETGEKLILQPEVTNKYDPYAVKVLTENNEVLGYIPHFYSQSVCDRLNKGMTYECTVTEVHDDLNCQECLKVKLVMPKR